MALDSFLKLDGIKGESQVKGFEEQIQILAWSWGMSQSGSAQSGTGAGAGKVNVSDISFTHYVDSSTPTLMGACCSGKHFPKATLTMRKAGGDAALKYVTITLEDLLITSVSTGGEDLLTENVTVSFARYKFAYQPQSKQGGAGGGEITQGWDMVAGTAYA